jgi:type II secretory pathway component PulF
MYLSRHRQLAFLEDFALGLTDGLSPGQVCHELAVNAQQQGLVIEQRIVRKVMQQLNAGQPLGPALREWFADDLVMLVAVGERSGVLEQLLQRQQQFEGQRRHAQLQFWKPLLYPLLMLSLALIATAFIGNKVMPKLAHSVPESQWPLLSYWLLIISDGIWLTLLILASVMVVVWSWGPGFLISFQRSLWRQLAQYGAFVIRRHFDAVVLLQTLTVLLNAGMNLDRALAAMYTYSDSSMAYHLHLMREKLAQGQRHLAYLFDNGLLSPRMLFRLSNTSRNHSDFSTLQRVASYAANDAVMALQRLRVGLQVYCYSLVFGLLVITLGGMGAILMAVAQQSMI